MSFKHHVFCCFQKRPDGHPRGCCSSKGAVPLWEHLGNAIKDTGREDIRLNYAGCLGACHLGPLMVVYPSGTWYRPETTEDIDEIMKSHLLGDSPVERLVVSF